MAEYKRFDYFYGIEADQFSFYRIPKELFTSSYFVDLSTDAKLLYGLMLDRMSLSRKNQWLDDENRVFIIFTQEDARDLLRCSKNKVITYFAELDKYGLITRKKQGQGKPTIIYMMNIYSIIKDCDSADDSGAYNDAEEFGEELPDSSSSADVKNDLDTNMGENCQIQTSYFRKSRSPEIGSLEVPNQKQEIKTSQNGKSRSPKIGSLEVPNQDTNNTNISYINISNTDNNYTDSSSQDKQLRDIIAFYKSITNSNLDKQQKQKVKYWLSKLPEDLILRALDKANSRNVASDRIFAYVESTVESYIRDGLYTLEQVEDAERNYRANKINSNAYSSSSTKIKQATLSNMQQPRGIFNNYNQKVYSDEEIAEIVRKRKNTEIMSDGEFKELKLKMKGLNNTTSSQEDVKSTYKPELQHIRNYRSYKHYTFDVEDFYNYYNRCNWCIDGTPVRNFNDLKSIIDDWAVKKINNTF